MSETQNLLELEKDKTNKEVAQSFGVPSNTLSTWKKNKDKISQTFQQGSATTKRVKFDTYEQVNKAVLKWFNMLRSKNHCKKMKFSMKDFFSKCYQIRSFLRTWSYLQKNSLTENFIFCAMNIPVNGVLIKEKALYFVKELIFKNFQASDGWLDKWKKRLGLIFFYFRLFCYIITAVQEVFL